MRRSLTPARVLQLVGVALICKLHHIIFHICHFNITWCVPFIPKLIDIIASFQICTCRLIVIKADS